MVVIPVPIPIGVKRVALVEGAVWKFVSCEGCHQPYAYQLELEARGEDIDLLFLDGPKSAERARSHAEENLRQKSQRCVLPIPCPSCGLYQAEMARRLKENASINSLQVVGASIAVSAVLLLFLGTVYALVLAVVLGAAGLALLGYGYAVAFRFDPNSGDAEPRKAIGQRSAVWGDELVEMLQAGQIADQSGAAERGGGVSIP
jgi:hypothetical protein